MGWRRWLIPIICTGDNPKPQRQGYVNCAAELGVFQYNCVYISHNVEVDLVGARKSGFSTILLDHQNIYNEKDSRLLNSVDLRFTTYNQVQEYFANKP